MGLVWLTGYRVRAQWGEASESRSQSYGVRCGVGEGLREQPGRADLGAASFINGGRSSF